jgi:trehalose synthase
LLALQDVGTSMDFASFAALVGAERSRALREAASTIRGRLGGGTLWHVNSTAAGGGVAEMLHTLIPLYRELGVPARWAVVGGGARFFTITKRLGVALYGSPGDGGPLGATERADYLAELRTVHAQLRAVLRPGDIVFLHDHQTAGLVDLLSADGYATFWRCHVGVDEPTDAADRAWDFLAPMVAPAHGLVF